MAGSSERSILFGIVCCFTGLDTVFSTLWRILAASDTAAFSTARNDAKLGADHRCRMHRCVEDSVPGREMAWKAGSVEARTTFIIPEGATCCRGDGRGLETVTERQVASVY
jgi:hypothetical protein